MSSLIHIDGNDGAPLPLQQNACSGLSPAEKEQFLLQRLASLSSVMIALSGGADSAYLAWAAHRALGHRAVSITAVSPSFAEHDRTIVDQFVSATGIHHEYAETHEMENPAYRANSSDRCYFCKDELFNVLDALAKERSFAAVAYGVNADDTLDFRPGHRAATEHHVIAPLLEAAMHKTDIRERSRTASLATWDRPASACLASRLPYGTEVTPERLALVARGEVALRQLGFRQFRVRLHGKLARVEIAADEMARACTPDVAAAISKNLKAAGFTYVALDLDGYRQGSLNESLPIAKDSASSSATGGEAVRTVASGT